MAMFIKIPKATGGATADQYQGWAEIRSMFKGVKNPVKTQVGQATDRNLRYPTFSHLTVYKDLDSTMVPVLQSLCQGEVLSQLEIHACHNDKGLTPYLKYTFYNVMLAEHFEALTGDGADLEQLVLHYTKFEVSHVTRDAKNKAGSPNTMGYDLEKAKVL